MSDNDQYKQMKKSLLSKRIKAEYERFIASIKGIVKKGISELPSGAKKFEASEQEMRDMLGVVIEKAVPSKDLQQKLKKSLSSGWQTIDQKQAMSKDSFIGGSCGYEESTKSIIKKIYLGKHNEKTEKYETNMGNIRNWLHEATHSVSQKYSEKYTAEHGEKITDTSLNEIESVFMEKVFVEYIRNHPKEMADAGKISGLDEINYNNEMVKLHSSYIRGLVGMLENGMKEGQSKKDHDLEKRYVVAEVVSSLMLEDYKKDPQKTMDLFNNYLEKNAEMTLDEAVAFVTEGKSKTYDEAVENYISLNKGIKDKHIAEAQANSREK